MIPRTHKIEPTTTVQKKSIREYRCRFTLDAMNSTQDIYLSFEGESPNSWIVCPANSVLELEGDFDEVWFKSSGNLESTDTVQIIIESDKGEDS